MMTIHTNLRRTLESVLDFIKKEYSCQKSQALDGEFLAPEARKIHSLIIDAISDIDDVKESPHHEDMLIKLLQDNIVITNSFWFYDLPRGIQAMTAIAVICNDIFYPAADAELINYEEIKELYEYHMKDNVYGHIAWSIKKRKQRPLAKVAAELERKTDWRVEELIA